MVSHVSVGQAAALKPITLWKRFDDVSRRFEHNHIEDGHVPCGQNIPTIKHESQRRAWEGSLWIKFRLFLDSQYRVVSG